jgi:hypothetical protein
MYTDEHDDHIADVVSTADVAFPYLTSKKKTEPSKRSNRGSYPHLLNAYQYQPSFPSCSQEQAGIASNLLTDGSIGADKIRLSVALDPDSITLDSFLYRLLGVWGKRGGKVRIPNMPEVYIGWDYLRSILYMEFNPSRFVWHIGISLCPLSWLIDLTGWVMQTVLRFGDPKARPLFATETVNKQTGEIQLVYPMDWANEVWVSVLHLSADFIALDEKFTLSQLEGVQPSRTKAALSYRNKGVLNTLTHVAAAKTTRVSLYNKFNERQGKPEPDAPPVLPNTYRFEVQLPRKSIAKTPLNRLGGCTESNTATRLSQKWKDSGFSKDLVWEGSMVQVIHASQLSNTEKNELIGYLLACQYGVPLGNYDPKDVERLDRLAESFRISKAIPITEQGPSFGHLELESVSLVAPLKTTYRRPRTKKVGV